MATSQWVTETPNAAHNMGTDLTNLWKDLQEIQRILETISNGTLGTTDTDNYKVDNISDADGDTKIQVEESDDEDKIRFDIGGTEQIRFEDGKLVPTTDNDVDLGDSTHEFKNLYVDGEAHLDSIKTDLTEHAVVVGAGTDGALKAISALTDGQLIVGATGADPAPQTIGGDATLAADGTLTLTSDSVETAQIKDGNVTAAKIESNVRIKGWIQFNGTGTIAIQDSYNVTSIADNGTGDYTVTWDTDFANDDYAALVTSGDLGGTVGTICRVYAVAVGTIRIQFVKLDGNAGDQNFVSVLAIGDQ